MNRNLAFEVERALADARRSPGWNLRMRDVLKFNLGPCVLFVVPARSWAYRERSPRGLRAKNRRMKA